MKLRGASSLVAQLDRLSISSTPHRPLSIPATNLIGTRLLPVQNGNLNSRRPFSSTAARPGNWLLPTKPEAKRSRKGRPRVPTGGSARGTTLMYGDYGLRMRDHDRRVSASQLKIGEEAIKSRLKGMRYRLYKRVCANIGVYTSGNEVRMGKGKGSFDHWASRIAVSKIIFEVKGDVHEQIAREAFRLAASKMPGLYEFVKKGDPPVVGVTKLDGITLDELKRPRREAPLGSVPTSVTSEAISSVPSTPAAPGA